MLEPVDRDGHILPLDPVQHRLDLPVLVRTGGEGALSPSQLRVLAMEVDRLGTDDPTFLAAVSEMAIDDLGDATAVVSGDLVLRFRPPLSHVRLRDGLAALEDAVSRKPDQTATSEEIIAYCKEHLAAYKYPRELEIRDELPKGPTGKLLKRALRDGK